MNWVVPVVILLLIVLLGAMFFALPWLTRPTIPLGVSIPSTHVDDPIVVRAVKRYRWGILAVTIVAALLAVLGALLAPLPGVLLPIVAMLVGTVVVYLSTRRIIQNAKRDGDWYRNVPVRLTATITAGDRPRTAPAFGWYLAGIVVLLGAVVVGAVVYDSLPDPLPIHWNADGVADGFAAKDLWSVFGPILLGIGLVALLFVLAVFVPRWPARAVASDSPEVAARIALAQGNLLQGLLGQVAFLVAVALGGVAVVGWLAPGSSTLILVTTLAVPLLLVVVVLLFTVRYRRATASARDGVTVPSGGADDARSPLAESPDDDRFWKAGSVYVNRNDPALMVPKRFGVGWTVNLGNPVGIALSVVLLLVVIGAIGFAVTTGAQSS